MSRVPRIRYMRHGRKAERIRHSKLFKAFLAEREASLGRERQEVLDLMRWPNNAQEVAELEDNDAPLTLGFVGPAVITEGQNLVYTLSFNRPIPKPLYVSVGFAAPSGLIGTGNNFVQAPAGARTVVVTMTTLDDGIQTGARDVVATLARFEQDYELVGNTTITTQVNDAYVEPEVPPVISIQGTPQVTEGGNLMFTLLADKAVNRVGGIEVLVQYSGTAGGGDFTGPLSVVFGVGDTSQSLMVNTIDDSEVEADETVIVTLQPGEGYTLGSQTTATGTIVDNDAPPTPQPTPDAMEAVISPAVTTRRSSYLPTKVGVIQQRPAWMTDGGNGVYWGDQVKAPSLAYPDRRFMYYSTDHANNTGGIGVAVCVTDPGLLANWKPYDDAVDAGWLADIPNLPAKGTYLFAGFGGPGLQYETPCVNKVGNEFVMTYQATNVPGARNQATLVAVSPNGISGWVGTHTPLMQVSNTETIGDGHMGYMKWGPNPFPRDVVPYDYVGYSLTGGQSRSSQGMWGSNAPKSAWTFIGAVGKWSGRYTPSDRFNSNSDRYKLASTAIDVKSIRATRQGYAGMGEFAGVGSGATARPGAMYEFLLGPDGRTMVGRPQLVVPRGASGAYDEGEAATGSVLSFGDKAIIVYNAANSANAKTAAIAVTPLRNPQNTWFNTASPAIPPASMITTKTFDFRGASALPAGLTQVAAGTTLPAPSFGANGMSVTVDGTMATKGEFHVFEDEGFDPLTTEYVDIYVEGWCTTSAAAFRHAYIGFSSNKGLRAALTDGFFIGTGETASATMGYQAVIAGAQPIAAGTSEDYWGVGYGTSAFDTMGRPKKNVGVRYYPKDNVAYILGEGGVEQQEFKVSTNNMVAAMDKTKRLYPFFGFLGTETSAATERVSKVTVKVAAPTKVSGAAVLGTIDKKSTSTGGNSPTGIAALNIGTAAADRVVAFYVCGRSAGEVTALTANFTPTGGSAVPLTLVSFKTFYADAAPATNFIGLFVANIPAGTAGVITPVATATQAVARWGVTAVPMYGVQLMPSSYDFAGALGTNSPHSVAVDKFQGGVTSMCTMHSTSGATLHSHAAEETLFDSTSQEVELYPASNSAYQVIGIRNAGGSVQIQNTNSRGSVSFAASWKKAA